MILMIPNMKYLQFVWRLNKVLLNYLGELSFTEGVLIYWGKITPSNQWLGSTFFWVNNDWEYLLWEYLFTVTPGDYPKNRNTAGGVGRVGRSTVLLKVLWKRHCDTRYFEMVQLGDDLFYIIDKLNII